jgi:hypothetical protein
MRENPGANPGCEISVGKWHGDVVYTYDKLTLVSGLERHNARALALGLTEC